MKKIIALMLITIMLLTNFSVTIYAANETSNDVDDSMTEILSGSEPDNLNKALESGTSSTNGKTRQENVSLEVKPESSMLALRIICHLLVTIPNILNNILAEIVEDGDHPFTIEKTVTNDYDLFRLKHIIDPSGTSEKEEEIFGPIGLSVSSWFVSIRSLALVGSVITLIYVGLRMAIATVVDKRASYKKMLFSWLEGLALLMVLEIFVVFLIYASDFIVELLKRAVENGTTVTSMETQIMSNVYESLEKATSNHATMFYTILFLMLSYYQIKFFVIYLMRVVRVAFYVIISPLVCLTYPLDKLGDGRPQAFNNWMTEITMTIFLLPMHLLVYIVMLYSMGEIIIRNPILGVAFLAAFTNAEKIFKSVLKVKQSYQTDIGDVDLMQLVKRG